MKVIFIPGNGGGSPKDLWFPYLKRELQKLHIPVIDSEFPDNFLARESSWIPFLNSLKADQETILVGHSSGAIAAMRFAEANPLQGSVLVGAYHTDLGIPAEVESGYFNRAWNWESIKKNQRWIIQFASSNDPWIPIEEARFVHSQLNTDYHESHDQGHFMDKQEFPELFSALKAKLNS
jgi:predicted alpha/beta hydrolase family esterase